MFKTKFSEPQLTTSRRRVVSLRSFEHCDVISIVDKSTDHGRLLSICFLTLTVLKSISVEVFRKIANAKKRRTNCITIISMVCSPIEHSSRPISAREFLTECHHIRKNFKIGTLKMCTRTMNIFSLLFISATN